MSSSSSDPRREEAIVPFHLPRKGDEEEDWTQLLATLVCKLNSKLVVFHELTFYHHLQ
jgi:hypothetical protein